MPLSTFSDLSLKSNKCALNIKDIHDGNTEGSESGKCVAECRNGVGWHEMRDVV